MSFLYCWCIRSFFIIFFTGSIVISLKKVDGLSLHGMSNDEAIELLRNTGPVVHLVIARVLEEHTDDERSMKRGLSQEDILQALANDELYGKMSCLVLCMFF